MLSIVLGCNNEPNVMIGPGARVRLRPMFSYPDFPMTNWRMFRFLATRWAA